MFIEIFSLVKDSVGVIGFEWLKEELEEKIIEEFKLEGSDLDLSIVPKWLVSLQRF
jgi:hypothetical protein